MDFLTKLWNWFNGNKTTIGLVLAYVLSKAWFANLVGADVVDALGWIADTFLAVGLGHKILKADTSSEPNK